MIANNLGVLYNVADREGLAAFREKRLPHLDDKYKR